jgi:SAM-dependent methyltransferase
MSDPGYIPQPLPARAREAVAARGPRRVAADLARWGADALVGLPWTISGSHGAFEFAGRRYRYLYGRHKLTWVTERAVEVPVIQALVDRHVGGRVLEVGNVLSHYRRQTHLVVDKYESGPGVLNRDVLDLGELGHFDLIVAISTLEHVGRDELPADPGKAPRAVRALRGLLAPGGRLAITIPVGYNRALDAALNGGEITPLGIAAMRRGPWPQRWREVAPADAWSSPYDFLLYRARAVVFVCFGDDRALDRA